MTTIKTSAVLGKITSSYKITENHVARAQIIAAAGQHGFYSGRGKAGQYWQKINYGQMIIGYNPKTNITSFHGFEGVVTHQELGDTQKMIGA
jgi:hypothetical protein